LLFNSYPFLFVFLPLSLIGYQVAGHFHRRFVIGWLGFVSLAFYAYWRPPMVLLLIASIAINYYAGGLISRSIPNSINTRVLLTFAITINLSLLCYYKYLFPTLTFISYVTGSSHPWQNVILPLGISFFTFTQIAYLIDLQQGVAPHQDLVSYVLFVTFFPHLIAGPILHHKEMMPQFQQERRYGLDISDMSVGFSWFILGMGKKVLLADNFAVAAKKTFNANGPLNTTDAWVGALSYCLQLYFDFSGYSDMALGLARMFSIHFPLNFNSPFKAPNIIEFWQRWHITLSRYITLYLYTPISMHVSRARLAAGKKASSKAARTLEGFAMMVAYPTIFSMFIAGIWHGAGLQYLVFGLLHGFYLTVNQGWRLLIQKRVSTPSSSQITAALRHGSSVLLTFLCALLSFVFFRSRSVAHATSILAGMAGAHHGVAPVIRSGAVYQLLPLLVGYAIVWFLPNTQQVLSRFKPSIEASAWNSRNVPQRFLWSPATGWALALGAVFFIVLVGMQDPSTFLYFQF
jgi:alginate O-acetyltransferase complex protein AlgI